MKLNHFKEGDLKKIETAIEHAEKKTAGEIVTLIMPSVSDYWLVSLAGGLLGAAIALGAALVIHWSPSHWGLHFEWAISLPLIGFLSGFLATRIPFVLRALTPNRLLADRVHREALAHFTALGISQTKDRTGVLIVISELEHRVEILADSGIHAKEGAAHWEKLVAELIGFMKQGKAAEGVVSVIQKIAQDLLRDFPIQSGDKNELHNRVLIGRQY